MKVYLLKDVAKLGRKGEIKDVSDGYFKNYLLKNHLALLATPSIIRQVEEKKQKEEEEKKKEQERINKMAEELKGKTLVFKMKVGEKNQLFEALSSRKILEALGLSGEEKAKIEFNEPIKKIGDYEVFLRLSPHQIVPLKIKVEKED